MARTSESGTVRIWDPLIRVGHWVLLVAFATSYLTEGEPEWLHTFSGYVIAASVALRVVWGIVGPRWARFSDFVTGPKRVVAYLRALVGGRAERHLGHSPAGGAMTVALLVMLGVTAASGMGLLAVEDGRGPLAGIIAAAPQDRGVSYGADRGREGRKHGEDREHGEGRDGGKAGDLWEEVHEIAANLTLALIVLHIAGVALASVMHRENLVRAMVTGRKRA